MPDLFEVQTLIDRAARLCGSKGALAEKLGVMPQHLSQWASGSRTCQPEDIAAMAHIAGFDAMEFLARAVVRKAEGTKKGALLKSGLGKYLQATGEAMSSNGGAGEGSSGVARSIRCIERQKERGRLLLRKTGLWPFGKSLVPSLFASH